MKEQEEENLCRSIYDAINSAKERFLLLEGKDKYALQSELLEWLSGDWQEMDVEWFKELN